MAYLARTAATSPKGVMNTKRAIKTAFEMQLQGKGFSLVEVLSTCPTQWGMTPIDAMKHVDDVMVPYYPLGEYKNT